jgi:hypothetical protein
MPTASSIVINDGASTPVAHTFIPIGKDAAGVLWFEQTTPSPVNPLGAKRIGYKQTRSFDQKMSLVGRSKAVWTLHVPTLETLGTNDAGITPALQISYVEKARFEFDLAERSTKQERKDTRVLAANLLAHALTVSNIDDLQVTYA